MTPLCFERAQPKKNAPTTASVAKLIMSDQQFDTFLDRGATAALYSHAIESSRSSSSDFTTSDREFERLSLSGESTQQQERRVPSSLASIPPPGFYPNQRYLVDTKVYPRGGGGGGGTEVVSPPPLPISYGGGKGGSSRPHGGTANRLVQDLYEWLCRRPEGSRHIGTNSSDDGGATFSEFYAEYPHHSAKRKCKGSGIKHVVEMHGAGWLEWIDSGTCGMGRVQVVRQQQQLPERHQSVVQLRVSGLPRMLSDNDIRDFFEQRGVIVQDVRDRQQPGRATVVVTDPLSMESARRLHGCTFYYGGGGGEGQNLPGSSSGVIMVTLTDVPPPPSSNPPIVVPAGLSRFGGGGATPPSRVTRTHLNGRRPALTVKTRTFERPAVTYAVLCKHSLNCQYGDKCRYAHSAAELDAVRRRNAQQHNVISPVSTTSPLPHHQVQPSTPQSAPPASISSIRENELRRVLTAAQIEEKYLPNLLRHELDVEALLYCDDEDFKNLGLALGPTVLLKKWCAEQRRLRRLRLES